MSGYVPSEIDIAWAAGLFEGEGSFSRAVQGRDIHGLPNRFGRRAALATTDRDVLLRFHKIVGVGSVRGPRKRIGARKLIYDWQTGCWADIVHVIGLFWENLGERRQEKALELLEHPPNEANPAKTHCPKGHPYDLVISGARRCSTCKNETFQRWYLRQKAVT